MCYYNIGDDMFRYLFDYVILLLVFIVTEIFLNQPVPNIFVSFLPTLNKVGGINILLIIPYTYLIVKLLFINKANSDIKKYINNKDRLMIITTVLNILFTIIHLLMFNEFLIELIHTIVFLILLLFLKPKKLIEKELAEKAINEYYNKK